MHSLKHSAGVIGAGKVHYACYYMCESYVVGEYQDIFKDYQLLVEAIIEFKRYLRRFLVEYRGLPYIETITATRTKLARGFTVVRHEATDTHYCVFELQTMNERIDEIKDHMYKPEIV